jgi:hypothetical protein
VLCSAQGIWCRIVGARRRAALAAASKRRLAAASWHRQRVQQRSIRSAVKEQSNWTKVDTDKRALAQRRAEEGGWRVGPV